MKSATSDRQDLVSREKQTNNLGHRGRRSVAEMTIHRITHHGAQFFTTLRLRHNRVTNRRGNEPSAQLVLLNIEDNFVHGNASHGNGVGRATAGIRGVSETGADVFLCEIRKVAQDVRVRHARSQILEHKQEDVRTRDAVCSCRR